MSGPVPTERIRNVLVVGHTGTGKSTLVEALLHGVRSGTPPGSRATVDSEPEERERGHSLSLAVASFEVDGYRINLLDTPGGAELLGDVHTALLAADSALFVVDATVDVQPQHEELWRLCEAHGLPRIVFCNKFDLERADAGAVLDDLRERYGRPLAAVHLPFRHPGGIGIVDVLHGDAIEMIDGNKVREPIPDDQAAVAVAAREALVEAVVENDDDLLERYLDGQQPTTAELAEVFAHGIAQGGFCPVLWGSVTLGIGVELRLQFLIEECPSPAEASHPLPHDGPTVAAVVKTYSDQFVGRINVLRLLSGELHADDHLTDLRTGETRRLHQLFALCGREQTPAEHVVAGDLVAVAKLDDVSTGDVLTADGYVPEIEVPQPPVGFHRVMLQPTSVADDDKLTAALQRLVQEDPSIRIELDPVAGTRVVAFHGPTHVGVSVARLTRRSGVEVEVVPAPIDYQTTIRSAASGIGRHVKQSGGHGQFGVVHLEVAPGARARAWRSPTRSSAASCRASTSGRWRRASRRHDRGPARRLPRRRRRGAPGRRQAPLGRLVRRSLPDGRHPRLPGRGRAGGARFARTRHPRHRVRARGDRGRPTLGPLGAARPDPGHRGGRPRPQPHRGRGARGRARRLPCGPAGTHQRRAELSLAYGHHDEVPDAVADRLLSDLVSS